MPKYTTSYNKFKNYLDDCRRAGTKYAFEGTVLKRNVTVEGKGTHLSKFDVDGEDMSNLPEGTAQMFLNDIDRAFGM